MLHKGLFLRLRHLRCGRDRRHASCSTFDIWLWATDRDSKAAKAERGARFFISLWSRISSLHATRLIRDEIEDRLLLLRSTQCVVASRWLRVTLVRSCPHTENLLPSSAVTRCFLRAVSITSLLSESNIVSTCIESWRSCKGDMNRDLKINMLI